MQILLMLVLCIKTENYSLLCTLLSVVNTNFFMFLLPVNELLETNLSSSEVHLSEL